VFLRNLAHNPVVKDTIRVRFAPSPTGYLHVGGGRTALFNWLFARHAGGVFVLRIEDTDRERSNALMTAAILDGMRWLGLDWDEGPFHQADGLERHRRDAERLLRGGSAYRCFCSAAELDARRLRAGESADAYRYDRFCIREVTPAESDRRASEGEPFAVRFRVPPGTTAWEDAVYGHISFDNADLDDFIILRTDGTPIYNMAVVSDDIEMRITHVLRGDDHVSNTPKQILLYQGLGAALPVFAHVPMILGPDGKRLSKRHGATAIGEYRAQGILPEAMMNFLALLGWAPGTDEEIFTAPELIERFSLEGINRKSAIFDTQKLLWLNGQHLMRIALEELESIVRARLEEHGVPHASRGSETMRPLLELLRVRARSLNDIVSNARAYFDGNIEYETAAVDKHWKDRRDVADRLTRLREVFQRVDPWETAGLERELRELADTTGLAAGRFIHPLRVALIGTAVGPGIFDVAAVMGRPLVMRRLDRAIDTLTENSGDGA
jgi:glutamyl-tRNA synthetase